MAMQGVPVRWAHSGARAQPGHGTGSPTCHRMCAPGMNATALTVGAHAAIQAVVFNACGIKYRASRACAAQGGIASGQNSIVGKSGSRMADSGAPQLRKQRAQTRQLGRLSTSQGRQLRGTKRAAPHNHRAHASQVRGVPPLKSASPWRCQDPALAAPPQPAPLSLAARSSERPCPQPCPPTPAAAPPPAAQGCTRTTACSELGQAHSKQC